MNDQLLTLPIARIDLHPALPRAELGDLAALSVSMSETGMINRVLVRKSGKDRYQLLIGKRRLLAAKKAKQKTIEACVRELDDREALEAIAADAMTQLELNAMEKAALVETMSQPVDKGGLGLELKQIGAQFGKTEQWACNIRRMAALPEPFASMVRSRELTETKARTLLKYIDKPDVLAAIADDMGQAPDQYATRDLLRMRIDEVAAAVDPIAVDSNKPIAADSNKSKPKANPAPARPLSDSQALILLKPYLSNLDDLKVIKAVIDKALRQLNSNKRSA